MRGNVCIPCIQGTPSSLTGSFPVLQCTGELLDYGRMRVADLDSRHSGAVSLLVLCQPAGHFSIGEAASLRDAGPA